MSLYFKDKMGIQNRDGALYFASGIANDGLRRDRKEALGIIKGLMSEVTSFDVFGGIGISAAVAFAQAAKGSYNFSKEFDKNMREVMTISSAVSGNFEGYKDQVIKMTTEIPVAATESAKALYQIVSAGHDGAAGMKILEASAKAAIGGVTETATAADAITTLINAYKVSADEANKISDMLFTTARLGKTTFGELGQSIAQVAPIAASYGVEMDQVLAAVATLTKSGTPTAQAMTQIRASIVGVSKVLGDGAFETRTYQEALQEVADRAGGSESKLRALIPEIEAVNGVLGLTGMNAKAAAADLADMNNSVGATEDAYRKMADGTDAQLQLLRNNITAYLRPLGESIMKTVSELASAFNEAFASGDLQKSFETLSTLVKIAAGAFATYKIAVGAVTLAENLRYQATLIQMAGMTKMQAITDILRVKTAALNKTMLANPYVLAAMAIVALGYAIYKMVTYTTDAEKAIQRVDDANKEFQKSVVGEQITIDRLFGKLKAATEGTKEYENAKKAIIAKYGQYLDGLDNETKSLKNVESAYRAISEAAKQAARDRAIEAATTKASDTYVEVEVNNLTKIKKLMEEKFGALNGTKYFEQLRKEVETGKGLSEEIQAVVKKFEQTKVIATPGGPATTYQFNDMDVYISRIKKGKEVLKTEMKEIDAVLGSVTAKAPKSLKELNSELEIAQKNLEDLKRVRPDIFIEKEISDQEAYIEKIKNSIKVLEDQKTITEKKNAEIKKTVEWYDAEIKKLKDLQAKTDSRKGYKNEKGGQVLGFDDYQKKINDLEKSKESITGRMSKEISDVKKAYESLGRTITESELKLQEDQLAVMEEGKSKRLAQSKLEYDRRQIEIQKEMQDLEKQYKDAGKVGLTDADKKRFSDMNMTNDAAWEKRDSDINDEYTKQIEEHTKALADVFVSEEQRKISAINERYRQEKEWADKQLKGGGMTEKEHKTFTGNLDRAKQKKQTDALLADLNDYQSQRQKIIDNFKAKEDAAGDDSVLLEKIQKGREKALGELDAQMLMQSEDWRALFDDMDNLTATKIDELVATIEGKLADGSINVDPVNLKVITDKLNQAKQKVIEINPFRALGDSFVSVFKKGDKESDKSTEDIKKNWQNLAKSTEGCFDFINDAISSCSILGDLLGESGQATLGMIQTIATAGIAMAAAIKTAETSSVILTVISVALSAVMAILNMFNKDKQHEKKIQALQKEVQGLERAYDKLGKAIDKSYSSQKVGLIDQQEANLKKQQELLKQQIAEEQAKKKTDQGKIDEWQNQIMDLNDEIAEMKERRIEAIIGKDIQSAIDDFASAYADAWAAGEDKCKAIKDVVKDMIKDAVIEMIKMRMNPEVAKLMEFLSKAVVDGIDTTEQGIIDRMTEGIYQAAEAASKGLEQFLEDPEQAAEAQKEAGLAGAVRRELTEETGSELTGLFRSYYDLCKLQLGVNTDALDVYRACLLNIQEILKVNYMIEHNTSRMVEEQEATNEKLDKVDKKLDEIGSNTKSASSTRSLGL